MHNNGSIVSILSGHKDYISRIAFSPDEKTIVTTSWDSTIKIWNIDGSLIRTIESKCKVTDIAFIPGKEMLVSGSGNFDDCPGEVKAWDYEGNSLSNFENNQGSATIISSNHDGSLIAAKTKEGLIKIWDKDGYLTGNIEIRSKHISKINFSKNDKNVIFFIATDIGSLTTHGRPSVETWKLHSNEWIFVDFNEIEDSSYIAVNDKTEKLAYIKDGNSIVLEGFTGDEVLAPIHIPRSYGNNLSISPNGQWLAFNGDKKVNVLNVDGKHYDSITASVGSLVGFSQDSENIFISDGNGNVSLHRIAQTLGHSINGQQEKIKDISLNHKHPIIAVASNNNMRLWNLDGRLIKHFELQSSRQSVGAVEFSPNGAFLVSADGDNKSIRIWSHNGDLIARIKEAFRGSGANISISSDNKYLLVGDGIGNIAVWDIEYVAKNCTLEAVEICKSVYEWKGYNSGIEHIAFTPNGQRIVSVAAEERSNSGPRSRIKIWSFNGDLLQAFGQEHGASITAFDLSSNGNIIVTSDKMGKIGIWNAYDGTLIKIFNGHNDDITAIKADPNSRFFVSSSNDGTIRAWNFEGYKIAELTRYKGIVSAIDISPDGGMIATAGYQFASPQPSQRGNSVINITPLPGESLLNTGCQWLTEYIKANESVAEYLDFCKLHQ